MITFDLGEFMFELADGAVQHVGRSTQSATVKLYDVVDVDVWEYGDERVKVAGVDDDGNEVEVALFPEEARDLRDQLESIEAESDVFD